MSTSKVSDHEKILNEAYELSFPNQEELMIIRTILEGRTISEATKELEMSVKDTTFHYKNGMKKAGCKSIRELVGWAIRFDIISDPPREDLVNAQIEIGSGFHPKWIQVLAAITFYDRDIDIAKQCNLSISSVKFFKDLIRKKFLLGTSEAILVRFAFQVIKPFVKVSKPTDPSDPFKPPRFKPFKPSTLKYGTLKYPPMYQGGFKPADIDPDIPIYDRTRKKRQQDDDEKAPYIRIPKSSKIQQKPAIISGTKIQAALEILGVHPSVIYISTPGSSVVGSFWDRGEEYLLSMLELAARRHKLEIAALHSDKRGHIKDPKQVAQDLKRAAQLNAAWTIVQNMFARRGYELLEESILNEMPFITKKGKDIYADDKPLRSIPTKDVHGNIAMIRESRPNSFFADGYTFVWFMDSEQAAQDMISGKIPYLMFPKGTIHSGGSPILDIWKKRFQNPGHEHVLGALEANTSEQGIFLDMPSVKPGYRKNTIARKMVQHLQEMFPEAEISHSSPTEKGRAFLKKSQYLEPRYQTPEDREDMMRDQMDEGFHDYAKLEVFYYSNDAGHSFWFFRNGQPAGEIQFVGADGYMLGFGVQRSLQRTGLGKAMLKCVFNKTGLDKLKFNSSAHFFYHKIGGQRKPKKVREPDFVLLKDKLKDTPLIFKDIDKITAIKYLERGPIDPWPTKN